MVRFALVFPSVACMVLSGCSLTQPELRYPVPRLEAKERVRISYRTVEVRDVSLPTYAAFEEISLRGTGGALELSSSALWADEPARAVTLSLARSLGEITGATVASEPWPFNSFPDARVEVRVEDMLGDASGTFRLEGQYFVAALGEVGRDRARRFVIELPLAVDAGPKALATARAEAVAALALLIARDGLR